MANEENKVIFDESYDKADFGLVDAGDYEVVLKADKKLSKDGTKEFLNLCFKIRSDVPQNFKNRCVFETAFKDKERTTWFDLIKLNKLVKTQKGLPTFKVEFNDVDECIQYLNGLHMIITIDKKYDDFSEKEINEVRYLSYRPSEFDKNPTPVAATTEATTPESPILDSDLPF